MVVRAQPFWGWEAAWVSYVDPTPTYTCLQNTHRLRECVNKTHCLVEGLLQPSTPDPTPVHTHLVNAIARYMPAHLQGLVEVARVIHKRPCLPLCAHTTSAPQPVATRDLRQNKSTSTRDGVRTRAVPSNRWPATCRHQKPAQSRARIPCVGQVNCAQALTTASRERRAHLMFTRPETKLFFHQERCAHLARNICMSRRLKGLTRQAKKGNGWALDSG